MPRSVLVVEDCGATREALATFLQSAGLTVAEAVNGREALQRLRGGRRPRVILLDLMMPVMDGWAFLAERRQDPALAAVPVVIFTAAYGLDAGAAKALGAEDVLGKPADPDAVLAAVLRHLPVR
jgi:CheY-like chemotaxis protein